MSEKFTRSHSHERIQAVERMRRDWRAQEESLYAVRRFNATVSTGSRAWFWPTVAAALVSRRSLARGYSQLSTTKIGGQ